MKSQVWQHLSDSDVEKYLANEVSEEEALRMNVHMSKCEKCAEKVRTMRRLNFLFNQWTAKAHAELLYQYQIVGALNQAAELHPDLKDRLHNWLKHWQGKAEAALRVVLKVPGEATQIIFKGWEAMVKPEPHLKFDYAVVGMRPRGVRGVTKIDKTDKTKVRAEGIFSVEVSVNEINNEVIVQIEGIIPDQKAPLILLIPDAKEQEPLLSQPERESGTNYYVARFQNVPAGRYTLVFEPME
jgi:hypothetical protein